MKSLKISLFIAVFFAFISFVQVSHASTIDDSISLQTQYQNALVQLIGLLQQEVNDLLAQLKVIQDAQVTQTTQIQQVVQNTTPSLTPVFGDIPDQSAILVGKITFFPPVAGGQFTFGDYFIPVSILDKNGNYVNGIKDGKCLPSTMITMTAPDADYSRGGYINNCPDTVNGLNDTKYFHTYVYEPTSIGEKIINFSVGNLSATTTITVQ